MFKEVFGILCNKFPPTNLQEDCPVVFNIIGTIQELVRSSISLIELVIQMFKMVLQMFKPFICKGTVIKATLDDNKKTYTRVWYPDSWKSTYKGKKVEDVPFCQYVCGYGSAEDECWSEFMFIKWWFEGIVLYVYRELLGVLAVMMDEFARLGGYNEWSTPISGKEGSEREVKSILIVLMDIFFKPFLIPRILIAIFSNFVLAAADKIQCSIIHEFWACIMKPICTDIDLFRDFGVCGFMGSTCVCNHCANPYIPSDTIFKTWKINYFPCLISTDKDKKNSCDCLDKSILGKSFFPIFNLQKLYYTFSIFSSASSTTLNIATIILVSLATLFY